MDARDFDYWNWRLLWKLGYSARFQDWQIGLSLVILGGAIWGVMWLAARIYRVGILMYGKKPTFPELMKWVTHH